VMTREAEERLLGTGRTPATKASEPAAAVTPAVTQ
jgi:hypothetical protein